MDERKEQFRKHFEKYDITEPAIIRKYYHSIRVMDLAILIAKYAGFNDCDTEVAAIAGLLHDYGRFEQWTKYKTYKDKDSIDHGDLAVERLFKDNEIVDYKLDFNDYDEVYDAIKYHNKYSIPDSLSKHNELLCKVIRDADKLDIFYLRTYNNLLIDNQEISNSVREQFFNEQCINKADVKNYSDGIILIIAMVYDLNFKYSFEYLEKTSLIWKIFSQIEDQERFREYFEYIDKYIKERVKC